MVLCPCTDVAFVLLLQTLDVLLQILVVFPKVEPLRCKVWYWAIFFFLFILLISLLPTASYFTTRVTDFLFFLVQSGHIVYSPHGGYLRSIGLSLSPKDIGAVACGKWGISMLYLKSMLFAFHIGSIFMSNIIVAPPDDLYHFSEIQTIPFPLFFLPCLAYAYSICEFDYRILAVISLL